MAHLSAEARGIVGSMDSDLAITGSERGKHVRIRGGTEGILSVDAVRVGGLEQLGEEVEAARSGSDRPANPYLFGSYYSPALRHYEPMPAQIDLQRIVNLCERHVACTDPPLGAVRADGKQDVEPAGALADHEEHPLNAVGIRALQLVAALIGGW